LGFEVKGNEGLKGVAGKKGDQQETLDGVRFMAVDMVGMPAVDEFVEALILDVPSLMAESDDAFGGLKWTPLSRPFFARNKLMFGRVVVWVFGWPQHQDHPLPFRRSARRSGRIPAEPYPPSEYLQV